MDSFCIEEAVLKNIFRMKLDNNLFIDSGQIKYVNVKLEYKKRLTRINYQMKNLINLLSDGLINTDVKNRISNLEAEKKNIIKTINNLNDNIIDNKVSTKYNLESVWNLMSFEEKRMIIMHLISKIVITDDRLDIFYKLS